MNARVTILLTACLLGPLCTGCTTAPGVVRGQSPAAPAQNAVQHAEYFGNGPAAVTPATHVCNDACGDQCDHCGNGHLCGDLCSLCGRDGCNGDCNLFGRGDWMPTHYHWYTYEAPKNLVYPPQNVPAAVVSYPYYTCKGPDCFFKAH